MDDLKLSAPERMILEALQVAPDLPKIQDRAQVILRAAEGMDDKQIAAELNMRRKDVLHWRKRFLAHGIRGLWDQPGPGPVRKATPEKKQAVVWDTLHGPAHLRWNAKLLGKKHGLGRSSVDRIWKEHGLRRARYGLVNIDAFRVFADPLFGIMVSGVEGIYCGSSGVLALKSVDRPFAELTLLTADSAVQKSVETFLKELTKIAQLRYSNSVAIIKLQASEEKAFATWLETIEARREPEVQIHLLTDLPDRPPVADPVHQKWLADHARFQVHYAPITAHLFWATLVRRWFRAMSALPVQAGFVQTVLGMTQYLQSLSDNERLGIFTATRLS